MLLDIYVCAWMVCFGVVLMAFHDPDERTEVPLMIALFVLCALAPAALTAFWLKERVVEARRWVRGRI